jgi:2'-5' RNA ligase
VSGSAGARRLFFALWPDDGLRARAAAALAPLTAGAGGRPQRPDQLHVTLAFLGEVVADRVPLALAAAAELQVRAFEVVFDRVEYWRKPRVLCLAASAPPPPLLDLVADLQAALRGRGFELERRPYRAHLTAVRKARPIAEAPLLPPLRWQARGIALVESVSDRHGLRYRPLARWPAPGPSPGPGSSTEPEPTENRLVQGRIARLGNPDPVE